MPALVDRLADELGFFTLAGAGSDVALVIALRMLRLMAFGATSLILVLFLKEIGISPLTIGLFMTATFLGDLVASFLFSLAADSLGRRLTIAINCVLMAATGCVFAWSTSGPVLTAAAVVGILTPGGGEAGPFRSIEQSAIALLVSHHARSDIYAWYTFLGFFCQALGLFLCGWSVDLLREQGYMVVTAYQWVFLAYAALAVVSLLLTMFFSARLELEAEAEPQLATAAAAQSEATESTALVNPPKKSMGAELDRPLVLLILKISALLGLDAFASSLVQGLWLTYYVKTKFGISATTLGLIFFATTLIAGFGSLLSTPLTKRHGAVITMVATHLPASVLLILLPAPQSLVLTLGILAVRLSTQSMDVAPKHVFLATLIPAKYRTSVFAWTNIVKTFAQMFGPPISGCLIGMGHQWVTFVAAGSLKVTYDLGMLASFLAYNWHQGH